MCLYIESPKTTVWTEREVPASRTWQFAGWLERHWQQLLLRAPRRPSDLRDVDLHGATGSGQSHGAAPGGARNWDVPFLFEELEVSNKHDWFVY